MNYKAMSDYEINCRVAQHDFPEQVLEFSQSELGFLLAHDHENDVTYELDYCNSWEDIGPIIESEMIELFHDLDSEWYAQDPSYEGHVDFLPEGNDKNPKRAAAICYLIKKDNEK